MFAGIGYFTLPAAKAGAQVHAMEINPAAFSYLCRNSCANRLDDRIVPECGDCRSLLCGEYDRIIMGHFDAAGMISAALDHARTGTVIHLHSIGNTPDSLREKIEDSGFRASIISRRVKKYSPGVWHMVQDVTLS
jgi:tRNA wybutosine-synthesizing protein 2